MICEIGYFANARKMWGCGYCSVCFGFFFRVLIVVTLAMAIMPVRLSKLKVLP